ncbi:hypothetical protein RCL1_006992 [Eukaryota sp. TZLM3-RCL]
MIELLLLLLALSAAFKISVSRPLSFVETFNNSADNYHIVSLPSFEASSLDFVLFTGFVSDVGLSFQHFLLIHHVSLISSRSFLLSSESACIFEDARFSLESTIFPNNQFTLSHLVTSLSDSSTDLILIAYDFLLNQTSLEHNELSLKIYSFLNYKSGKSFDNVVENELISIEIPSFSAENPNIPANISITHHSNSCNSSFPHLISFLSSVSLSFCISTTGYVDDDSVIFADLYIPPMLTNHTIFCFFNALSSSLQLSLSNKHLTIRDPLRRRFRTISADLGRTSSVSFVSHSDVALFLLVLPHEKKSFEVRILCLDFRLSDLRPELLVTKVVAGFHNSAFIFEDGSTKLSGRNNHGQLGDSTKISHTLPVSVAGNHKFIDVAFGLLHVHAIDRDGMLWSWGYNGYGTLGDSTLLPRSVPVRVSYNFPVLAVSCGEHHSLLLATDGTVLAWGRSENGRLGVLGLPVSQTTPVVVQNLLNVAAISAGSAHSLAVKEDGTVCGWGEGAHGRIGNGLTSVQSLVSPTHLLTTAVSVSCGGSHSLVLTSNGDVYSFGNNMYGQLGLNDQLSRSTPVKISGFKFVFVSAGKDSSLGLLQNGDVRVFGRNQFGQLGNGSTSNRLTPQLVSLSNASVVSMRGDHVMFLSNSGSIIAWGSGEYYKLGFSSTLNRHHPAELDHFYDI